MPHGTDRCRHDVEEVREGRGETLLRIVGDALNPVIDALHRNGNIDFVSVRHEEYGGFAAVADGYMSGQPVAVCGTAGAGTAHLFNGLMDARKERAPVIAIAGDVETSIMDTSAF